MQANDSFKPIERTLPWVVFCAGYVASYFLSTTVQMPLLWYLPLERRFTYEVKPLALGADFYGRVLLCLVAGALCAGAAVLALRSLRLKSRPEWLRGMLVWLVGMLLLTAGLHIYILKGRQPTPAALPSGYVAR